MTLVLGGSAVYAASPAADPPLGIRPDSFTFPPASAIMSWAVEWPPGATVSGREKRLLHMEERVEGESTRLVVTGELDLATAPAFAERLERLNERGVDVLVDLSRVKFMDCSGLSALVHASFEARRAGRRFELAPLVAPQVRRILELTETEELVKAA